ncbi:hypothetical protein AZL_007080 [Azospirillum sp. B510]|uniref:hypothetical protein n=1 Tax=Azospirillum sp. (strain B510) TaxID=137722 RepID=UPI0001C4C13F|nr:hypothetical protein [Azospirillum sp. B510]BAI71346.1 hypothetical protein AZL_007080 [Azospirillum sp. B510]
MSDFEDVADVERGINSDLVNSAEGLFAQDATLSEAATYLYANHNPNIDDLATVLTAIWAESLGVGSADPNTAKLTNTLYNAGGDASGGNWSYDSCRDAARKVFTVWHGGLIRKSLTDRGTIPQPSAGFHGSPDIISNGPVKATWAQLAAWTSALGWRRAPWVDSAGDRTYLYVRERNLFPDRLGGTVSLFACRAGIGIGRPSDWQLVGATGDGDTAGAAIPTVGRNAIGINRTTPFVFDPAGSRHPDPCFVALFSTPYFRNPPPGDRNAEVAQWLAWNGAAGWRSTAVAGTAPRTLGLANLDATPERFRIDAVCHDVPVGTLLWLRSADDECAIDECAIDGRAIDGGWVGGGPLTVTRPDQRLSLMVTLPGNHDGAVAVTVLAPDGGALPKGAAIDLRAFWLAAPTGLEAAGHAALFMGNFILTGGG